jgi:hypothetical protein
MTLYRTGEVNSIYNIIKKGKIIILPLIVNQKYQNLEFS